MAYALDQQDPNQQQQQPQPNAMMTSSAPGSGPGASTGKAATPQSAPAQPFQNLSAYLNANAPQVNQQASKIAGDLTNQYGQVQSDIGKGAADFGKQVQGGYAQANPDVVNAAATNPAEFAAKPENVKAFQSLYNDTYTGPSDFESSTPYANLNSEVNRAVSAAGQVGTTGGLKTYFQSQNPNATEGGNTLDTALLQGSPQAYTQVQSAAKPFANLNDFLSGAVNSADAGVWQAKQAAKNIATQAQEKFTGHGGVISGLKNSLNNTVAQKQQEALAREQAVKDLFSGAGGSVLVGNPNYSDQAFSDLGLDRSQLQDALTAAASINNTKKMSPIDLPSYLGLTQSDPGTAITRSNVANPNDYATVDALQRLTGQNISDFLNPADQSQAGTANLDLTSVQPDNLAQLLALRDSLIPPRPSTPTPPAYQPGYVPYVPPSHAGHPIPADQVVGTPERMQSRDSTSPPSPAVNTPIETPASLTPAVLPPLDTGQGTAYVDPVTGQTRRAF